jgi:hypothetical protein
MSKRKQALCGTTPEAVDWMGLWVLPRHDNNNHNTNCNIFITKSITQQAVGA